jgi:glycosyltransferase A (GT-A) superfamily protein (DUF2064 family)
MTIAAAQRQGLTVCLLEPLFDVDELPDLLRLAQLLAVDATRAPATAAHLATMRNLYEYNNLASAPTLDLHRADQSL